MSLVCSSPGLPFSSSHIRHSSCCHTASVTSKTHARGAGWGRWHRNSCRGSTEGRATEGWVSHIGFRGSVSHVRLSVFPCNERQPWWAAYWARGNDLGAAGAHTYSFHCSVVFFALFCSPIRHSIKSELANKAWEVNSSCSSLSFALFLLLLSSKAFSTELRPQVPLSINFFASVLSGFVVSFTIWACGRKIRLRSSAICLVILSKDVVRVLELPE